jgi:hypothetical protein
MPDLDKAFAGNVETIGRLHRKWTDIDLPWVHIAVLSGVRMLHFPP